MQINLNAYGCANPVEVSNISPSFVNLVGTMNLLSSPFGPEGVLYRRITKIEDAITCGGLMLINAAGTKWQFWVGADLVSTMAWSQIGKCATDAPGLYVARAFAGGGIGFKNTGNFVGVPSGSYAFTPGIEFTRRSDPTRYFDDGEPVFGAAIITAAHYGMGIAQPSSNANYVCTRSYMSTVEPMNVTFSSYMERVRASALATIPSAVRKYYDSTFSAVLAAFPQRDVKPVISANSMWKGRGLVDLKDTGRVVDIKRAPDLTGQDISIGSVSFGLEVRPGWYIFDDANIAAINALATSDIKVSNIYSSWGNTVSAIRTGSPIKTYSEATSSMSNVQGIGPGSLSAEGGTWKGMNMLGNMVPRVEDTIAIVKPHNGTLSGFSAGQKRDGHMLQRSLNELKRFALDVSTYADLGEYVTSTLNNRSAPYDAPLALAALTDATDALATAKKNGIPRFYSTVSSSNLPFMIESFNKNWDDAAATAAKADA